MSYTFKTSHSEPILLLNNLTMLHQHYFPNNDNELDFLKSLYNNNDSSVISNPNANMFNIPSFNSSQTNNNINIDSSNNNDSQINQHNYDTFTRAMMTRHQSYHQFNPFQHYQTNYHALHQAQLPSPLTLPNYITNRQQSQPQQQQLSNSFIVDDNPLGFCVRFAVNGMSKFTKGNQTPPMNKNIQAGDFGDDAGMIAENSRCIVIGLADGAGGNRSIGIDPQVFSRSLLGYCVEIIKNEEILPNQMAKLACKSVQTLEARNIDGSGTLCLLALNKQNSIMHAFNIGDSGFRLVRNGKISHKSEATMAGSSPKQLYVSDSSSYSGISFVNEEEIASDSDIREFPVKHKDIIVLSSDGMYDVVPDHVIEKIVNNHSDKDLQGIADELLLQSMKSYIHTQRDDILIMVCRVERKI